MNPETRTDQPAPEEERQPKAWLFLAVNGVLLLLLGVLLGMKISDYFHGKYFEKEMGQLLTAMQLKASELRQAPAASAAAPLSPMAQPQASTNPATALNATDYQPDPARSSGPPDSFQNSEQQLVQALQERERLKRRFENYQTRSTSAPQISTSNANAQAVAPQPNAPQPLTEAQRKIQDAPAIAKIQSFDADWGIAVINGGRERNLTPGTKLAVCRDIRLLGLINLEEVFDGESVAELTGEWKSDKPQPGDKVIAFPIF